MIETIQHNDEVYAVIIRREFDKDGIEFFTPPDFSQQLGYMKRPEGYKIQPHVHKKVERKVNFTQEVLYIKNGKVKMDLYHNDKSFFKEVVLEGGDVVLLASGGHGFEMLEESTIIEVKQGPYIDADVDKEKF